MSPRSGEAASNASTGSHCTRARLDKMIQLKLLVAEQQATIDTLSSRLHNLELASQRQALRGDADASRIRALEEENRNLARRLAERRGREISPRKGEKDEGF